MGEYERLREKLLGFGGGACATCSYDPCPFNEESGALCPAEVDYILSLVEIKSDDQGLPEIPKQLKDFGGNDSTYKEAQEDMLKPDKDGNVWVKVAPKPNV